MKHAVNCPSSLRIPAVRGSHTVREEQVQAKGVAFVSSMRAAEKPRIPKMTIRYMHRLADKENGVQSRRSMAEQHLFYRYRVLQPRKSLGLKRGRSTVLEWRTVRLSVAKRAAGSFL